MRPFHKRIGLNERIKFCGAHKIIFAAMHLLASRRASGVRYRGLQTFIFFAQGSHQTGLSSATGRCNHKQMRLKMGLRVDCHDVWGLFNVLNLLAHLLYQHLHIHRDAGEL